MVIKVKDYPSIYPESLVLVKQRDEGRDVWTRGYVCQNYGGEEYGTIRLLRYKTKAKKFFNRYSANAGLIAPNMEFIKSLRPLDISYEDIKKLFVVKKATVPLLYRVLVNNNLIKIFPHESFLRNAQINCFTKIKTSRDMQTIKAISYGYHQESNQPSAGEYRLQFSRIIGCKSFTVKADPTTFEVREVIKSEKGIEEVVFANNGKRDNRSRDDEKRLMGLVRVPYPNSNNSSEEKKLGILEANALYLEGVREMNFFIKEVNLKEDFKTDVEAIITTLDDAVMA